MNIAAVSYNESLKKKQTKKIKQKKKGFKNHEKRKFEN